MSNKELNSNTLANSLAKKIHDDIAASGLSEGELFMTGEQVAERYQVSRSIAREALSQLRALGLLKSRQRKGLLVGRPDLVHLMERWVPFYSRGPESKELTTLAQLRYVLELGAVDLTVANATPEYIGQLDNLAMDFEHVAAEHGHNEEADRIDCAYHSLILEMTGNTLITGMHKVLSDYFFASEQVPPHPGEDPVNAIRVHHMIVEALQRKDRELVRSLLRTHLENTLSPSPNNGDSR